MNPLYGDRSQLGVDIAGDVTLQRLLDEVPWLRVADTRSEFFMADAEVSYTYGRGRGERTYTSQPYCAGVRELRDRLNEELARGCFYPLNVCFLNRYDHEREHLGWHADDHPGTDHTRPIAVVSFGQARKIQWRLTSQANGLPFPGEVHEELLEDGSLFVMPPGFQQQYQHRIPKGGRKFGPRVSLTFRAFK